MNTEVVDTYQWEAFVFSNFSTREIEFYGEIYKTVEHCYHCQRYSDSTILYEIKNAKSPDEAREISQKYKKYQISHFDAKKVFIMKQILLAKLSQHTVVFDFLKKTGNTHIEKRLKEDAFWGTWVDWNGQNMLWKLWMELKIEIK